SCKGGNYSKYFNGQDMNENLEDIVNWRTRRGDKVQRLRQRLKCKGCDKGLSAKVVTKVKVQRLRQRLKCKGCDKDFKSAKVKVQR
ncbi:hypothetical protein BgiMline_030764, partial [Biomphalaria glabrata]